MALNASGHVVVIDVRVGPGAKVAEQQMNRIGSTTARAGVQAEKTKREFASLAGAFTALFAVGMVKRGMDALVKPAVEYRLELARLKSITGANEEELRKYEKTAARVAAVTPYGPTQMVASLLELRRATGSTEVALSALDATAKLGLASFGKMGLQGATRMSTETIKTFGLEAGQVNDAMERLAALTKVTGTGLENFQNVMARLGTAATVTGQSFDQVAMAAVLSGRGITQPTRNVQLLSSALKMLQQSKAREALLNIGVEVIDPITGAMRDLSSIFLDMARIMETEPVKVRASMAQAFGQRGGEAIGAILNQLTGAFKLNEKTVLKGTQVYDHLRKAVRESGGLLSKLANDWLATAHGQFEIMTEKVGMAKRALGDALLPVLTTLGNIFGTLAHALASIASTAVGKAIFTGAGIVLVAGGGLAVFKALWFGISKIFMNVASNIGLIAVNANTAAGSLGRMTATATSAAAATKFGALGAYGAGGGGRWARIGGAIAGHATPIIGTAVAALTTAASMLGESIVAKLRTGGQMNWLQRTGMWGARQVMPDKINKMFDSLLQKQKSINKEIELAVRKRKDEANAIQIGSEMFDKMRSQASAMARYEPPEVKGRIFSAMEAKLKSAAGNLTGADKKSAEYALAAAGTARGLMNKAAKGIISPEEQTQLMNALNTMGAVGWHFNKMFGPSIMGASLLKSFGSDVTGQVAEMGSKENVEMMRIIARSRGMKYTTSGEQIPGTSAYAGGMGDAPGAKLMRDYPFHTKVFKKPAANEAQQNMVVDIMGRQSRVGEQQSRTLEAILYQLRQPLKVEVEKADPMGSQSKPDYFPGS